jgi:hypothetical protein
MSFLSDRIALGFDLLCPQVLKRTDCERALEGKETGAGGLVFHPLCPRVALTREPLFVP